MVTLSHKQGLFYETVLRWLLSIVLYFRVTRCEIFSSMDHSVITMGMYFESTSFYFIIKSCSFCSAKMAKVEIYYDSLILVEYIEAPAYDVRECTCTCVSQDTTDLLTSKYVSLIQISLLFWNISLVAGLFLGVSVMSMFEIVNLCEYLWAKYKK